MRGEKLILSLGPMPGRTRHRFRLPIVYSIYVNYTQHIETTYQRVKRVNILSQWVLLDKTKLDYRLNKRYHCADLNSSRHPVSSTVAHPPPNLVAINKKSSANSLIEKKKQIQSRKVSSFIISSQGLSNPRICRIGIP